MGNSHSYISVKQSYLISWRIKLGHTKYNIRQILCAKNPITKKAYTSALRTSSLPYANLSIKSRPSPSVWGRHSPSLVTGIKIEISEGVRLVISSLVYLLILRGWLLFSVVWYANERNTHTESSPEWVSKSHHSLYQHNLIRLWICC